MTAITRRLSAVANRIATQPAVAPLAAFVRWMAYGPSDAYKARLGTGFGSVQWALHRPDVSAGAVRRYR